MFDKFIKQRPADFKGYEGRAFVLLQLDRSKDALKTYSDLLVVDPNNSECLNLRANLNIKLGNFSNALDDAIKAAKIDPSESVLSTLVQAKVQVSEYEDALTVCKVLIKKAGENEATYHLDFARILRLMNKQQQAIKTLEEVIKSDQKNTDAYYQLAVTHTELGEVDKAKSDLNILSTIPSDDCHLYSKSGLIKLILGVNDGAFEDGVNCFDLAESGDSYERYGFIVKLLATRGIRSERISKRLAIEYKSFNNREQWPGPIVSYLTDEISLNELMKLADTNSKMTDALAYAGLNKIFLGDEKAGLELLQKVEKHGNKYSPEFEAARAFLKMNNRKQ